MPHNNIPTKPSGLKPIMSPCFCGSRTQERLSSGVLTQGLSWGCTQDVRWGCITRRRDQGGTLTSSSALTGLARGSGCRQEASLPPPGAEGLPSQHGGLLPREWANPETKANAPRSLMTGLFHKILLIHWDHGFYWAIPTDRIGINVGAPHSQLKWTPQGREHQETRAAGSHAGGQLPPQPILIQHIRTGDKAVNKTDRSPCFREADILVEARKATGPISMSII